MSQAVKNTLAALLLLAPVSVRTSAQDIVPLEYGSRAICASPNVSDAKVVQEALLNTERIHPGIFDAVRQQSLQKGTLDLKPGDQNLFWVYNIAANSFDTVRAELKAAGTISYVWVALGEWNNGHVTPTEVDAVLNALERLTGPSSLDSSKGILQLDRQVYGDPPNVDASFQKGRGDGKTHFLLCDIQDGWIGTGGYVAGFFYSVDVDPNSGAVQSSNRRDILYVDSYPGIFYAGQRRTGTALATLAHEFQHLIHWNYDPRESTFFNEGLSEYAEFLSGYQLRSPSGYLANTNVTLTSWNNSLVDYSRATLWTRYLADQYGLRFIKTFVQNPASGVSGFEQSLSQSGYLANFTRTMIRFFTANWIGSAGTDSAYRYRTPLSARPALKGDYVDPNIQRTDTLVGQGAQYISFASAKNFKITFSITGGAVIRAVESGPTAVRVRDVSGGTEFTSPELGTTYSSVVFVVMNTPTFPPITYSYAASGDLLHFLAEESHDSGTPHEFSPGFAPYLGFGNNATTLGMAVRFQPAIRGNVLRKARMMLAFNQDFKNGTASPSDSRNIVFHVWRDLNGRPGTDIIPPFLVSVDRNLYPLGAFVDVDLSAFQNNLTNLSGPVYVGFMEDINDSVGTYLAADNLVPEDYSYVYRGPRYTRIPNTWESMREVSAVNNHSLDGFNLMVHAVFEYTDSSAAPSLTIGYLQNPILSENIDIVATGAEELRSSSLSGIMTQTVGSDPLRFFSVPGTAKAFLDTSHQLKGSGSVSLKVKAAKRFGIFYTDTTVSVNAGLLRRDESAAISTPEGSITVGIDAGALPKDTYVTAFDGVSDPQILPTPTTPRQKIFTIGPFGLGLSRPLTVKVSGLLGDEDQVLATVRDGKWIPVPSTIESRQRVLVASISRLGVFGVFKKSDVGDVVQPGQFALYQNYPNPFNPTTAISYQLPAPSGVEGSAISVVELKVFDVLGREVAVLVNEENPAGAYAIRWDASALPSGVYFYRLTARPINGLAEVFSVTRKMVFMK